MPESGNFVLRSAYEVLVPYEMHQCTVDGKDMLLCSTEKPSIGRKDSTLSCGPIFVSRQQATMQTITSDSFSIQALTTESFTANRPEVNPFVQPPTCATTTGSLPLHSVLDIPQVRGQQHGSPELNYENQMDFRKTQCKGLPLR